MLSPPFFGLGRDLEPIDHDCPVIFSWFSGAYVRYFACVIDFFHLEEIASFIHLLQLFSSQTLVGCD